MENEAVTVGDAAGIAGGLTTVVRDQHLPPWAASLATDLTWTCTVEQTTRTPRKAAVPVQRSPLRAKEIREVQTPDATLIPAVPTKVGETPTVDRTFGPIRTRETAVRTDARTTTNVVGHGRTTIAAWSQSLIITEGIPTGKARTVA